jgi:molecular chaperone Hsp33
MSAAGPSQGANYSPPGGSAAAQPQAWGDHRSVLSSDDALTPFVFEHAAVRGGLVTLGTASREILACHPYPPALARALGELLAATTLLSSTLKFKGSVLAQLAGDGPVRLAVVECSDALDLRATAQWDARRTDALPQDATLAALAGGPTHGRLTITLDPRGAGSLYQGIVALEATSIGGLIEHYLSTSEQLPSRLMLAARDGAVAGALLQRLPSSGSADDATWARLCSHLDGVASSMLLTGGTHPATLSSLFPADDLRLFDARVVRFRCSCSRERVINALRIAGRDEIEAALAAEGRVEVTCEFCNRVYAFDADAARGVFSALQRATATRH